MKEVEAVEVVEVVDVAQVSALDVGQLWQDSCTADWSPQHPGLPASSSLSSTTARTHLRLRGPAPAESSQ